MQSTELKEFVVDKIDDLKAKDIVTFDVSSQSTITEHMVICSGTSSTHVRSMAEYAIKEAKQANIDILGVEGRDGSEWVLVDFGGVVLHVMQQQTRDFYQLERLWAETA